MLGVDFLDIIVIGLASFRLTRLIVFDKITEFIRIPFFDKITEINEAGETDVYYTPKSTGIKKVIGELLSCYWCTGMWASLFLVLFYWLAPAAGSIIIVILAVAAVGSIIETVITNMLGS
ncbi:DUF1360 domain-containing protein [Bacillota bacterium Lsc_1132]